MLIVAIAVVAAVVGVATMLRVNRALADASISDRGDVASANAAARAEAARLVAAGYAGLVTGHTHEPEISPVGTGFYANTGCGTEVVRTRKARFGLPRPFLAVRRLSMVELTAGPTLGVSLSLEERPIGQPAPLERLVLAPERARPETMEVVGHLPDGADLAHRRAGPPAVGAPPPGPPGGAFTLLFAGLLNVLFAVLWPIRWTRPVNHWLPFGIHPVGGVTAVIGGLALAGVARGVRSGYRRAWVAALVILLVSTAQSPDARRGPGGLRHRLPVRRVAVARTPALSSQPRRRPPAASAGPSWLDWSPPQWRPGSMPSIWAAAGK